MIPYFFNMVGLIGNIFIAAAGVIFLWMAWQHHRKCEDSTARVLMFGSFLYLPIMQLALVFGKI
jgi:heme o synthase